MGVESIELFCGGRKCEASSELGLMRGIVVDNLCFPVFGVKVFTSLKGLCLVEIV